MISIIFSPSRVKISHALIPILFPLLGGLAWTLHRKEPALPGASITWGSTMPPCYRNASCSPPAERSRMLLMLIGSFSWQAVPCAPANNKRPRCLLRPINQTNATGGTKHVCNARGHSCHACLFIWPREVQGGSCICARPV